MDSTTTLAEMAEATGIELTGPFLTDRDLEEIFPEIPRRTWGQWRWLGRGPEYFKEGHHIRYPRPSVVRWAFSRLRRSTSDPGPEERPAA